MRRAALAVGTAAFALAGTALLAGPAAAEPPAPPGPVAEGQARVQFVNAMPRQDLVGVDVYFCNQGGTTTLLAKDVRTANGTNSLIQVPAKGLQLLITEAGAELDKITSTPVPGATKDSVDCSGLKELELTPLQPASLEKSRAPGDPVYLAELTTSQDATSGGAVRYVFGLNVTGDSDVVFIDDQTKELTNPGAQASLVEINHVAAAGPLNVYAGDTEPGSSIIVVDGKPTSITNGQYYFTRADGARTATVIATLAGSGPPETEFITKTVSIPSNSVTTVYIGGSKDDNDALLFTLSTPYLAVPTTAVPGTPVIVVLPTVTIKGTAPSGTAPKGTLPTSVAAGDGGTATAGGSGLEAGLTLASGLLLAGGAAVSLRRREAASR